MSYQYVRLLSAALAIATALSACGSSASSTSTRSAGATATASTTTQRAVRSSSVPHRRTHRRPADPGSLPQTHALPTAHAAQFRAEMAALWRGIRDGKVGPAMPAFFPEGAYAQVKAIANPRADYAARLVGEYALDVAAAHALLGVAAPHARLVRVVVPAGFAHWVAPGVCYNRIGYYEVPNARLVYADRGRVRSMGIASMISWRGVWYVVHLGAVTRSRGGGVVDAPSDGPGTPAPSSTC